MTIRDIAAVLRDSAREVSKDKILTYAAALAFYTALSLPALVVLLFWVLGLVDGNADEALRAQAKDLVGPAGAKLVDTVLDNAERSVSFSGVSAGIGTATLLFAASGIFAQLQAALNEVWDVTAKPGGGLILWLRKRFLSMGLVGVLAFLLLVSLTASAAISGMGLEGSAAPWARLANGLLSVTVFALLFAAVFKLLPDVKLRWRDVAGGALVTSVLFSGGKAAISFYLAAKGLAAEYGAAGSTIVVLAWVYFTSALVLFGSEMTQCWLTRRGFRPEPNQYAARVDRVVREKPAAT